MLTSTLFRTARPAVASRLFSTTARTMAAGDVGAPPKVGGQGDAFQKREKANEDYVIKQREADKLKELKKQLAEQHEALSKLESHINELDKEKK